MATSLTDTDIITYENNTSNNIDTFIKREIRRITTNSVQDRKHPMFAVPPLPQSAPWANDPEAMYNADPLFCSGNFHEEMDRLQSVRSGINVKGWISGHRLHCARCALIRADWLQNDTSWEELIFRYKEALDPACYGLRCITYMIKGYLPCVTEPIPTYKHANYRSLLQRRGLLAAWNKQCRIPAAFQPGDPRYVSPLSGSEKFAEQRIAAADPGYAPKCRVCLDASREINGRIAKWPLRYEDFASVMCVARPGEYYGALDIDGFYLRLPVAMKFRKYLSFIDPVSGKLRSYAVLPFGISTAPGYASAVSAEARAIILHRCKLRGIQVQIHVYLDDLLFRGDQKSVVAALDVAIQTLADLGLPAATAKTQLAAKKVKHLGRVIDSDRCVISMSPAHKDRARDLLAEFLDRGLGARDMRHLCGLLSYLEAAVFASRPRLRSLWAHARKLRAGKVRRETVTGDVLVDATWWFRLLLRNQPPTESPWMNLSTRRKIHLYTDASGDVGGGAWIFREFLTCVWDQCTPDSVPYKELYVM